MTVLLFQLGGSAGPLAAGAIFFAVCAVAAYIAYRIMKKTVKMAFRMTIVVAILLIAVVGGFSLWWLNSGSASGSRPPVGRPR